MPSSVKSSQSKHLIMGGMLPHNVISASAVASARNSLNILGNPTPPLVSSSATPNSHIASGGSHFRPNNELKNHMLNLSLSGNGGALGNPKGIILPATGGLGKAGPGQVHHNSKDRMKQIMEVGGVPADDEIAKIKRIVKKK